MDDPLLKSTSPSDFWGKRWNSLVQTCLKNGVFKVSDVYSRRKRLAICCPRLTTRDYLLFQPIYKHFSKPAGVMATFLASGLLHEWLVLVIFTAPPSFIPLGDVMENSASEDVGFEVVYGGSVIFFVWQAMLILVESFVGNWEIFQTMGRILPAPVRTPLIVGAGIPVRCIIYTYTSNWRFPLSFRSCGLCVKCSHLVTFASSVTVCSPFLRAICSKQLFPSRPNGSTYDQTHRIKEIVTCAQKLIIEICSFRMSL
jgi:hypothetical protein